MTNLVGLGLYTPQEASQLLGVPALKIRRWVHGHKVKGRVYQPLWTPQIDLGEDSVCLGFRDLMEVRVVDAFIKNGVTAQRVRAAIALARQLLGEGHPLSTNRFRTDGRNIFYRIIDKDEHGVERERLLDLFKKQYEFKQIVDPLLKTIDFDGEGNPRVWWPAGRTAKVVVDPSRAFGKPIDVESSVPTNVLAAAAKLDGFKSTAMAYDVPITSVRRAVEFESSLDERLAA